MFELPLNPKPVDVALHGLMRRYQQRVPDVGRIVGRMIDEQVISNVSEIQNDHIAFRTMGVPGLGISSLEKLFLAYGYERRDRYRFDGKKLNAFWYAPPDPKYPRVFISELCVDELSETSQGIIKSYTSQVTADPVDRLNLQDGEQVDEFLHSPLWRTPFLSDYQALAAESEYAAWVIYNRYYLNHFTISVHGLKKGFNTIESFNAFLIRNQFRLNDAGGITKVSADGLLKQSSTVAQMVLAEFTDKSSGSKVGYSIPGSYVEFAERLPLPEFQDVSLDQIDRHQRRDGFEAANADKIFESTYAEQTSPKC